METDSEKAWETLSPEEKKRELYEKQKALLETFLQRRAISQAQYDKSLHDLTVKMGYGETTGSAGGSKKLQL